MIEFVLILVVFPSVIEADIALLTESAVASGPREYCLLDSFQPRCWKNEVIVMKSAVYGRMYYGRCLVSGELGCSADVLDLMHKKCSGKMECTIRTPDPDVHSTKPCSPGMEMFFEASYECVTVIQDSRSCSLQSTSSPLYISSLSSSVSSGCGTPVQPWTLEASVGQRVNISLLDFASSVESEEGAELEESVRCHPLYGYIVDKTARKNVSICGSRRQRDRALYVSQSNSVTLVLLAPARQTDATDTEQATFLLRFQAVGCSFLIPPQDAWLKRREDELTVGCYSSLQTWTLRCVEHKWTGALGNCSAQYAAEPQVTSREETPQVFVLVSIAVLGLTICLAIICIGAVCLKRYQAKQEAPHPEKMSNSSCNNFRRDTFRPLLNSSNTMSHSVADDKSLPPPTYSVYNGGDAQKTRLASDDLQYFVLDIEAVAREDIVNGPQC